MKKLLFPLATAMLLLATSCDDDKPDQPVNSFQLKGSLPTCIMPEGGTDADVIFTDEPVYSYTLDSYTGKWTVGVSNLKVPSHDELRFTSPAIFPTSGFNIRLEYTSPFAATQGGQINNVAAVLADDYYYYTGESTTGNPPMGTLTTMAFDVVGQYKVRAFPKSCYYGGTLVTTYPMGGAEKEYTSTTPQFGVKVNLASRTAEVTIHNVKFAAEMPITLAVITLKDLKLVGDEEDGYKIVGTNIVPVVGQGASATPNPKFTFNEFEMHPTNTQMTMAEIDFTVANQYEGEFQGSFTK